jgi:ParB/RepB/Spo0J family partition protein
MPESEKKIVSVLIEDLDLGGNIRSQIAEEKIREMAVSLRAVGLQVPISILPTPGGPKKYGVTDGKCRVLGAITERWTHIDSIIGQQQLSRGEVIQRQLIMNCQREGLSEFDQVMATLELIKATGWSGAEVARKTGWSESKVSKHTTVGSGPEWLLALLKEGKLPVSKAYLIASEPDAGRQQELLAAALAGASRDALAGRKKQDRQPSANGNGKHLVRVTCPLPGGGSFSMSAAQLTTDSFVTHLEDLLAKARKGRAAGWSLQTLIKALKDTTRE